MNLQNQWGLEAVLEGGEEGAGADLAGVGGAGEGAVGDVLIAATVEEVVPLQRKAQFGVDFPHGRGIEQHEVGGVSLGKMCEEMLGPDG